MKKVRFLGFLILFLFFWWSVLAWLSKPLPFFKRKKEYQLQKFLGVSLPPDYLIIYNSGGWGNASLEKVTDFRSVILGIKNALNQQGYKSLIIPYIRARETLFGRVVGIKEVLSFFRSQSRYLAEQVDAFIKEYPDKKVIIVGLSMGALFVDEVMKRVRKKSSVFAIKVGMPFYADHLSSENIIEIKDKRDALALGDTKVLFFSIIKGIKGWFAAKIKRKPFSFSKAMNIPGHHFYSWDCPDVKNQILDFLKDRCIE